MSIKLALYTSYHLALLVHILGTNFTDFAGSYEIFISSATNLLYDNLSVYIQFVNTHVLPSSSTE